MRVSSRPGLPPLVRLTDGLTTYIQAMRTAAEDLPPSPDLTLHGDLHGGSVILNDDVAGSGRPRQSGPR